MRSQRASRVRFAIAFTALAGTVLLATGCITESAPESDAQPDPALVGDTDVGFADEPGQSEVATEESTPETAPLGPAPGWTDPEGNTVKFTEVTADAGLTMSYRSALRVQLEKDTAIMMGGAGAADFDNDGDTDLFVLGGGVNRDALFVNDGQGKFADVTVAAGLDELHLGAGVAIGDYDSDGWLDIFVTSHGTVADGAAIGSHRLYRNNSDLTFTDVAAEAGVATTSTIDHDGFGAVFGDIDLDGDLDLFVPGWQRDSLGNRLFENQGDGTFADVTVEAGIIDDGIRGFSACLTDTTGDFYPELLLVADFGTSKYFANTGDGTAFFDPLEPDAPPPQTRFVEYTRGSGTGSEWSGMGTAMGDVNNDGLLDWYATAIFDADSVGRGDGNKLYINQGENRFREVASEAGVADGGWGWGAVAVDVNHDGWLDLIETNGWDLPSYVGNLARMWISDGAGGFTDVVDQAGPMHNRFGLGVVQFDMDGDGDQDVAITASNDAFSVFRNDLSGPATAWLRVSLDTSGAPALAPNGIGAMVRATVGENTYSRSVGGCSNFNSTSELTAHFGLGGATVVNELRVEWPNGEVTILNDIAVDQNVTVTP